jgi:A/G-specific adenine glycosylase
MAASSLGIIDSARVAALRRAVKRWYSANARDLPWRGSRDPYHVLVSEIMLQQTQVDRVAPKYRAFLQRFPTLRALARARLADVLRSWSGLGYNARGKRLKDCAEVIVSRHGAKVPADAELLQTLPGVGRYTACAVSSFAFGAREPVVDVNVQRVLSRTLLGRDDANRATAWSLAAHVLPRRDAAQWSQALMDLGARFCRSTPKCAECPARRACRFAAREHDKASHSAPNIDRSTSPRPLRERFTGSRRYFRGRIVRALAGAPSLSLLALGEQVKDGFATTDLPWLRELLFDLEREGLIALIASASRAALP